LLSYERAKRGTQGTRDVFSINVLRLIDRLPHSVAGDVVARQLARSATSVAANYRSVCTAQSRADFIAKLSVVVEEAEECVYWLDLIVRATLVEDALTLRGESNELRAIFSKSLGTARANRRAAANATHGGGQQIVRSSH
jgi:four helix bundle protein